MGKIKIYTTDQSIRHPELKKPDETVRQYLLRTVRIGRKQESNPGGQSCGVMTSTVTLTQPELDLYMECGYYRSQLKNAEELTNLFTIFLDNINIDTL